MTPENSIDAYMRGSRFEAFMRKAFPDKARNKPGMNGAEFQNLINSENGESFVKHLGSTAKLLTGIKKHMEKAMNKYLSNKKLPENNLAKIEALGHQISRCNSSDELYDIICSTIELTQVLVKE